MAAICSSVAHLSCCTRPGTASSCCHRIQRAIHVPWGRQERCSRIARAGRPAAQAPRGSAGDEPPQLTPEQALIAALRESGVPLEQIQVGRAPDDDETWADLLDAETDDPWMRNPQLPEYVEELLGGDLQGSARPAAAQQQQGQPPNQP